MQDCGVRRTAQLIIASGTREIVKLIAVLKLVFCTDWPSRFRTKNISWADGKQQKLSNSIWRSKNITSSLVALSTIIHSKLNKMSMNAMLCYAMLCIYESLTSGAASYGWLKCFYKARQNIISDACNAIQHDVDTVNYCWKPISK